MRLRIDYDVAKTKFDRSTALLEALEVKMTSLMTKLQEKARSNLEAKKSSKGGEASGQLSDSISNPRADIEGSSVVGRLDWGEGAVDPITGYAYAKIQEYGGIKGQYPINPLGKAKVGGRALGGTRPHGTGTPRRYGADLLYFIATGGEFEGSLISPKQAFRQAIEGKHFMRDSLDEMRESIITELRATILGTFEE